MAATSSSRIRDGRTAATGRVDGRRRQRQAAPTARMKPAAEEAGTAGSATDGTRRRADGTTTGGSRDAGGRQTAPRRAEKMVVDPAPTRKVTDGTARQGDDGLAATATDGKKMGTLLSAAAATRST
ncbi:hypothetical protein GQ55_2G063800 [Panicum hallii var. hallii]|uniref:Uncharacterized protein n=1 Tax=Panicum hallii var. hallii TaxID=1504633 RepID=A0A2T7EM27_9POAL|nr:hypothetical protein GQ55_2G063800 [Panicum hallii var. hallii]